MCKQLFNYMYGIFQLAFSCCSFLQSLKLPLFKNFLLGYLGKDLEFLKFGENHQAQKTRIFHINIQKFYKNSLVAFISLDLSSAFDTVKHEKLLHTLENKFFISGNALNCFRSYLKDRYFCVRIQNEMSCNVVLKHGVPQGSVTFIFIMYISVIYKVVHYPNLSMHFYPDDTELYCGAIYYMVYYMVITTLLTLYWLINLIECSL